MPRLAVSPNDGDAVRGFGELAALENISDLKALFPRRRRVEENRYSPHYLRRIRLLISAPFRKICSQEHFK